MEDQSQKPIEITEGIRHRAISLLQELIRLIPDGEEAVQRFVAQQFERLGCEYEVIHHLPCHLESDHEIAVETDSDGVMRTSVAARWPTSGKGRSLLIFAHPDNEPIADIESWTHPPFAGVIEHGRLYGWGVADDLLGVAAMISGLEVILDANYLPQGEVILASTPSKRRAQGILAVLDRGYEADAGIYLHPAESGAGLADIKATTSGLLRFRIKVEGQPPDTHEPTHTPFYHLAVNPIDKMWDIYNALQGLANKRAQEVVHPALEGAVGRSTNLQIAYVHCGNENKLSQVSKEAFLAGSVTFPPNEPMIKVQSEIKETIRRTAEKDAWLQAHPPEIEWVMGSNGVEIDPNGPLYQTVSQAIRDVTGQETSVHPLHSASDIRNPILHKGIPTVGFGSLAGNLTQAGKHDEWIDVDDYVNMVMVVSTIIMRWCGVSRI